MLRVAGGNTVANMKFPLEILSLFLLVAGTLTQGKFVFENIGRFRLWHGLHYDYMKSERLKPYTEKLSCRLQNDLPDSFYFLFLNVLATQKYIAMVWTLVTT